MTENYCHCLFSAHLVPNKKTKWLRQPAPCWDASMMGVRQGDGKEEGTRILQFYILL